MENNIEKVTKILEKWFNEPVDKPCPYCEAAKEICQLFGLKPDEGWTELRTGEGLWGKVKIESKPDVSRLLTDKEIMDCQLNSKTCDDNSRRIVKAQDAKTASILQGEYERREKRIFKELKIEHYDDD